MGWNGWDDLRGLGIEVRPRGRAAAESVDVLTAPGSEPEFEPLGDLKAPSGEGVAEGPPSAPISIIPALPALPGPVNMTGPVQHTGPYTVAAGTYLYGLNLAYLFESDSSLFLAPLVNNGTIWSVVDTDVSTVQYIGRFNNLREVTNNGLMVIQVGPAVTMRTVAFAETGFVNHGSVYVLSEASNGAAFLQSSLSGFFDNTGLIAVQSVNGGATGYELYNGGQVYNAAGASILVEGRSAYAIFMGGDGTVSNNGEPTAVINDGRIEARSTGDYASIALYLSHSFRQIEVINSGVIKADIAIASDFNTTVARPNIDWITNKAGGVIEGAFLLDRGDDVITNAGSIVGDIFMEEGDDQIDTTTGTITGLIDMGWGDDTFLGSARTDYVAGDDGADRLEGRGGDDLMMGGGNDDVLIGGAGADGLYGEYGEDRIVTQEGDVVSGGAGDDRIEAGDFAFRRVDGGTGFDTLVLPSGSRALNLAALLQADAVAGIEHIVFAGGQSLAVQAADVSALVPASSQLRVTTTASDRIDLVGGWTAGADPVIGGVTYRTFGLDGATVLVAGTGSVVLGAASTGGGLDAAAGSAPPDPGGSHGLDYTSNQLFLREYELTQSVTVNAEETWYSTDGFAVLTSFTSSTTLTNYGDIISVRATTSTAGGIAIAIGGGSNNLEFINNYGSIIVDNQSTNTLTGFTGAIAVSFLSWLVNYGDIQAHSVSERVVAVSVGSLDNRGSITASTVNGQVVGVEPQFRNAFQNTGSIDVFATITNGQTLYANGRAMAVGVVLWSDNHINAGRITAGSNQPGAAVAMWFEMGGAGTLTNTGVITGQAAIHIRGDDAFTLDNRNQINGRVELAGGADRVLNTGTITGDIDFGAGADTYDGRGGTLNGQVLAGDGDDILIGGDAADRFDGGSGSDALFGGSGADTLIGGGHDASAPDYFFGGTGDDTYVVNSAMTGAQDLVDEGEGLPSLAGGAGDVDTIISQGALFWDFYSVGEILQIDNDAGSQMVGGKNVLNKTITGGVGNDVILTYGRSSVVDGGAGIDAISFELYGLDESYDGVNTVVMKPGNDIDYVYGFESGVDKVDLTAFGYGLTGEQWKAFLVDVDYGDEDYCFLYLGQPGQFLVFLNTTSSQLSAGDFL